MGELLIELKRAGMFRQGGDRRSNSHNENLKMSDLGIERNEASRSQKLARISKEQIENYFAYTRERDKEMSTAGLMSFVAQSSAKKHEPQEPATQSPPSSEDHPTTVGVSEQTSDLEEVYCHLVTLRDMLSTRSTDDNRLLSLAESRHISRLLNESVGLIVRVREQFGDE